MATIEELRHWCFGGDAPAKEGGTPLPDDVTFRAMAYRFDPERNAAFRDDYRCAAVSEFPLAVEWKRIAAAFRKAGVRFAPIKGADLAESCYPDPVLRLRCDIDIIVHPEDIDRAVDIARADGWRAAHKYKHKSHRPSMYKKNAMLELHFNLPNFPSGCSEKVWAELIAQDGSSEYRLPPELALTVTFHHARTHRWINGGTLIADYAFLLETHRGFDWELARRYAAKFGVADPGVLCFAIPELFPAELMPPGAPPPETLRLALREAVLHPVDFRQNKEYDVMNRGDRFGFSWWCERLNGLSPSSVRMNYHISDRAGLGRMIAGYLRMIVDRTRLFFRGMHGGDAEYIRAVRRAETVEKGLSELER